jgi:hypothetical protein
MENTIKISCNITTSDNTVPLGVEIWIDDQQIINQEWVTEKIDFCHEMPDHEAEHELRVVMKNKRPEHTEIDESGNIVKDACLSINDVSFDGIDPNYLITNLTTYTHDFNGTGIQTEDKFFGTIGCNGVVSLKFTTPVYLWLLENI